MQHNCDLVSLSLEAAHVAHGMLCHGTYQVWYGLVWHGMVWFGLVWYGMVWSGWYGMVWWSTGTQHASHIKGRQNMLVSSLPRKLEPSVATGCVDGSTPMVWYGMVWYGTSMVWYGMVWYGMVWYGMVWYGMVRKTK